VSNWAECGITVRDGGWYERCYRYLSCQRSVLWGEAFDIQDEKGRAQAAKWLADQIEEVMKVER
jgi:hypothetical protein